MKIPRRHVHCAAPLSILALCAACTQATTHSLATSHPPEEEPGVIYHTFPEAFQPDRRYVFYVHGKIIEEQGVDAVSPLYGSYQFEEILQSLAQAGFDVIGEVRPGPTDSDEYSDRLADQIQTLLAAGVPANHITVVGFSKGAGITILTSSKLKNRELNFVLIAICGEEIDSDTALMISGRILSLYEQSDPLGGSCETLAKRSPGVADFKEIEFSTGREHGTFYGADPLWIDPVIEWIRSAVP